MGYPQSLLPFFWPSIDCALLTNKTSSLVKKFFKNLYVYYISIGKVLGTWKQEDTSSFGLGVFIILDGSGLLFMWSRRRVLREGKQVMEENT